MAKIMSGQNIVTPDMSGLADSARAAKSGGLPPVHLWNPPFCGDIDMRIARDGTWFYEGTPIGRPALVRLFSDILKLEDGQYFLVTPVEKVGITVDDVPFIAVDFTIRCNGPDQQIDVVTHVGDRVTAGPDHPIRVVLAEDGEPAPYVMVRAGLEARIDRKSFYRLVDLGVTETRDGQDWFGIWSGGVFFPMIAAALLDTL